jgi:hypothetical protein
MWPIQLAFCFSWMVFLCSLPLSNTSSFLTCWSSWSSPSFSSHIYVEINNFIFAKLSSKRWWHIVNVCVFASPRSSFNMWYTSFFIAVNSCSMAEVVSHWHVALVGPGIIPGQSMWGFMMYKVTLGQVFLWLLLLWNQYFYMDVKHGLSQVKFGVRYKLL